MARLLVLILFVFSGMTANAENAPLKSIKTEQKLVALTFDDGPHATNTTRLLEIFAREHAKVTFFEIGKNVAAHPDLARAVLAAGHEIGNHSRTHPHLDKLDLDTIRAEITDTQKIIAQGMDWLVTELSRAIATHPSGERTTSGRGEGPAADGLA